MSDAGWVYTEYNDEQEVYQVRASKAKSWDALPVSVYMESASFEGMAERIVEKIGQVKPCRVLLRGI